MKQERVEQPSGFEVPSTAVDEEEDVKPPRRWVPFEGNISEEYIAKWMRDPGNENQEQENPIKEEPMEEIETVCFEMDEYTD
jgi:hypothetical protein